MDQFETKNGCFQSKNGCFQSKSGCFQSKNGCFQSKNGCFQSKIELNSTSNGPEGALIMVIFGRYFTYWGEN